MTTDTNAAGETLLLNQVVPPGLADTIADWLLEREDVPGFTSERVSGHGSSEHSMTLAEQVAGRSRRVMFSTYLPAAAAQAVLAGLREEFHGTGLNYWLIPVVAAGHLL